MLSNYVLVEYRNATNLYYPPTLLKFKKLIPAIYILCFLSKQLYYL